MVRSATRWACRPSWHSGPGPRARPVRVMASSAACSTTVRMRRASSWRYRRGRTGRRRSGLPPRPVSRRLRRARRPRRPDAPANMRRPIRFQRSDITAQRPYAHRRASTRPPRLRRARTRADSGSRPGRPTATAWALVNCTGRVSLPAMPAFHQVLGNALTAGSVSVDREQAPTSVVEPGGHQRMGAEPCARAPHLGAAQRERALAVVGGRQHRVGRFGRPHAPQLTRRRGVCRPTRGVSRRRRHGLRRSGPRRCLPRPAAPDVASAPSVRPDAGSGNSSRPDSSQCLPIPPSRAITRRRSPQLAEVMRESVRRPAWVRADVMTDNSVSR